MLPDSDWLGRELSDAEKNTVVELAEDNSELVFSMSDDSGEREGADGGAGTLQVGQPHDLIPEHRR